MPEYCVTESRKIASLTHQNVLNSSQLQSVFILLTKENKLALIMQPGQL